MDGRDKPVSSKERFQKFRLFLERLVMFLRHLRRCDAKSEPVNVFSTSLLYGHFGG